MRVVLRKSNTPGAGTYEPKRPDSRDKGLSKEGQSMFAGKNTGARQKEKKMGSTDAGVGPGSYDLNREDLARAESNGRRTLRPHDL